MDVLLALFHTNILIGTIFITYYKLFRIIIIVCILGYLEEGIVKVINWILGTAENLLNSHHKVGYDVTSAEDLRAEHEAIELECWETYGTYAELIHKINSFANSEFLSLQHKDLISQKEFMDFVCKSFAMRLERRRNVLITSLRFYRLVSEYFDRTADVFDKLVMGTKLTEFETAGETLKQLEDSQASLGKNKIMQ